MEIKKFANEFEVSVIEAISAYGLKTAFKEWKDEHCGAFVIGIETSSHGESHSRQNFSMTIIYIPNPNAKPE